MKKSVLIILLSVLSLTAVAQQKKVAVYVTGQESGVNKVLGDKLVAAFAKSGKYIAIERTAGFLAELGKEQNYQRTGAVDDRELSRLGKQFGVQLVCVADISDVFGEKYISSRLIDVESAEVINTSNATSQLNGMQELLKVTEELAKELTSKTVQEKADEAAAKQKEYAKLEIELKQMLDAGYIQIANVYVTISYSRVGWSKTKSIASQCKIGGMKNWRIPTVTEFDMVVKGIRCLQEEANFYPNIEKQLKDIKTGGKFWTSDKQYGEFGGSRHRANSYYDEGSEAHNPLCYLMLVHDVE